MGCFKASLGSKPVPSSAESLLKARRTGEREVVTGRARMHYSRAPDLTALSAFFGLETRLSATWRAAGLRDAMGGRRGNHRQRARYRRWKIEKIVKQRLDPKQSPIRRKD
jgi:hypothetical protein